MKVTIKRKWLKALRSGKYKQGREALRNTEANTYCCLGVLCRVMALNPLARKNKAIDLSCNETIEMLSEAVLKKAGLTQKQQNVLALKNDGGKTFTEIAKYIEKRL